MPRKSNSDHTPSKMDSPVHHFIFLQFMFVMLYFCNAADTVRVVYALRLFSETCVPGNHPSLCWNDYFTEVRGASSSCFQKYPRVKLEDDHDEASEKCADGYFNGKQIKSKSFHLNVSDSLFNTSESTSPSAPANNHSMAVCFVCFFFLWEHSSCKVSLKLICCLAVVQTNRLWCGPVNHQSPWGGGGTGT